MKAAQTLHKTHNGTANPLHMTRMALPDGREAAHALDATLIYPAGGLDGFDDVASPDLYDIPAPIDAPEIPLDLTVVKWVAKAAAKKDIRYCLNGIYLDAAQGKIVGTDGHRIHVADCPALTDSEHSVIIPSDSIKILMQLHIDQGKPPVTVKVDSKGVWLQVGDAELYARAIDGRYPDWPRVIPGESYLTQIDYDIPAMAKKHKAAARMLIERENARAIREAIPGTKPSKRPLYDAHFEFEHDGSMVLGDGTVIATTQNAAFESRRGIAADYAIDASIKGAICMMDSDKFLVKGDDRIAVVMARRV